MKITKRLLSILLALMMFVPAVMSGCKNKKKEEESTTADGTTTAAETYETDDWGQKIYDTGIPDELNFGGKEVNILMRQLSEADARTYEWYVKDVGDSSLKREIYFRNLKIEEKLGIKFNYTARSDAEINQYVVNIASTGGDGIDIVSNYHYYGTSLQVMECYKNLLHEDLTYLHLDNPYWNQNFLNTAKFQDRVFVTLGDMSLTAYLTSFCMYFNKPLLENICKISEDDIYKMVLDGNWTIDELIRITKDSAQLDGIDGDSDGDIYGFTSHYNVHAYDGFVAAFDIDLTRVNDNGNHTLMNSTTQMKLGDAADKLVSFYKTADVYLVGYGIPTYTQPVEYFKNGRSIFCVSGIGDSQHLVNMTDEYGLLPLPKYDADQDRYYEGVQDSHNTISVMYGDKDYDMISAVLEMLAAESYSNVRPVLFETVLKGRYLRDSNAWEVFDIILQGTRWDFSDIYPTAVKDVRNHLWRDALRHAVYNGGSGSGNVTTAIASEGDSINKALKELDEWLYTHY